MKNLFVCSVAAVMGFVCLVSCSEQESELPSATPSSNHQLRIVTHTREGEAPLANVYLFKDNALVRTIQTDADNNYTSASASVKLLEGSYTLCALNTSDLAHFQIPDNPTPTSVITKAADQSMGDFLMATTSISLSDGDNEPVDMTLQRKVLELSTISISQVPADVTAVSVSIAPFYSGIQFNGTYVETDPVTCTFDLVASTATSGLWQLSPQQLAFPSKGTPTITVTFTRGENDAFTYKYTADAALTANNKYNIAGTYTEPLGVTLTGTITFQAWPTESTSVNFDFDEQNASNNSNAGSNTGSGTDDPSSQGGGDSSETPVAGSTYKGCYVVSVDEAKHTAVLLSPTEESNYITKMNNNGYKDWQTCAKADLQKWTSLEGVTGTWRMPVATEVSNYVRYSGFYTKDTELIYLDGSDICCASFKVSDGTHTFVALGNKTILRPVIDISY